MKSQKDIIKIAKTVRNNLNQSANDEAGKKLKFALDLQIEKAKKGRYVEPRIVKMLTRNAGTIDLVTNVLRKDKSLQINYLFLKALPTYLKQIKRISGSEWNADLIELSRLIELEINTTGQNFNLDKWLVNSGLSDDVKTWLRKIVHEIEKTVFPDSISNPLKVNLRAKNDWLETSKNVGRVEVHQRMKAPVIKISNSELRYANRSIKGWDIREKGSVLYNVFIDEIKPEISTENIPADPPDRYADFTFYKEKSPQVPVSRKPLKRDVWYSLEVAVREKPTGIKNEGSVRPIREPRQSEDAKLYVTAYSSDFEISEPVQHLILPPSGDSTTNARFRVRPNRKTVSADDRAIIYLRIFYKYNLIEAALIKAEVVENFSPEISAFSLNEPVTFKIIRQEGNLLDFDDVVPRQMHIDVTKKDSDFELVFTLPKNEASDDETEILTMTAPVLIDRAALESYVVSLRKAMLAAVTSDIYVNSLENEDTGKFAELTNPMAEYGRILWTKLFEVDRNSSISEIGNWLKENKLPDNSKIQISIEPRATDFVFPWNFIYDGKLPAETYEPPDFNGFWGVRYEIEQRLPNAIVSDAPLNRDVFEIGMMLWKFIQADEQEILIKNLAEKAGGGLARNRAIKKASEALDYLKNCSSQIIYFFTHGHTQMLAGNKSDSVSPDDFLGIYKELSSKIKTQLKSTYEKMIKKKFQADRTWIELNIGKIYLEDLQSENINLKNQPVVFLNMCESAQVTPSLRSDSFIYFFLNRGASNVIGTECLMTPLFAHHFSKKFLELFLSGKSIGEALRESRAEFLKSGNPLGLFYTLYGPTTKKFDPPLLN